MVAPPLILGDPFQISRHMNAPPGIRQTFWSKWLYDYYTITMYNCFLTLASPTLQYREAAQSWGDCLQLITIVQSSRWLDLYMYTHYRSRGAHAYLTKIQWRSRAGHDPSPWDQGSARSGRAIYLFRFVVEECMHTFVAISTPRGEPGMELMVSTNLVLNTFTK